MCGRYAVNRDAYEHYVRLADAYIDEAVKADARGHYNAAPTQLLPIVYAVAGIPHVRLAKWGLVPYFSKTRDYKNAKGQRYNTINARMETVATSRTYKNYYKGQRCLVPALGFYEWKVEEGGKQPYFFTVRGKPLTFGGLWSEWKPPEGSTEDPLLSSRRCQCCCSPPTAAWKTACAGWIWARMTTCPNPSSWPSWRRACAR